MRYLRFCILILIFIPRNLLAQTTDFQTWSSVAVEKTFTKKWKAALQEELRLQDNSTRLRTNYIDFGVKYQYSKRFDVSGAYRFIIRPNEIAQRIYADFTYEQRLKDWTIQARIRVQHEFVPNSEDENYIRPDLTVKYKISKKWEPFIEAEFFYRIFYNQGDEFDESRLSAGTKYKFNKHHSIKGYYLYEKQFNVNNPLHANVLGLSYEYDW